ncbi:transcriptional regulator, XRE family with cupin sensor [Octadecabacter temperatus]|uniref:HTH-type transcriptional regulator PuuR n=1 Tax=Octadecabacter temperatus TaxID=1458307 RepID=A0A0K0Y9G9_9RHOB|nr:cupin domain-containing protein [Octadecabacter temperatus]AKS47546.1 HTH-type transcriptional regulator PuuR [Octadecabacter temperatus]SIO41441.1 transcriptional regulator, XRE family with cupin sensor [Octadecabacter temperatus]
MIHDLPTESSTLGADIRALRKARGLTLADLGLILDRSVGWLSQVERGLSEPSITDLRGLAKALDVSVSSLFRSEAPENEQGMIVRATGRRPIGSRSAGLVEELLSPDLTDDFEVLHSTFEPGAEITETVTRPTQEVGYIVSGKLDLWIAGKTFSLNAGDSFRVRGEPFRWMNPHSQPCIAIWVIAPPVY